jgi:hypothetical protein
LRAEHLAFNWVVDILTHQRRALSSRPQLRSVCSSTFAMEATSHFGTYVNRIMHVASFVNRMESWVLP